MIRTQSNKFNQTINILVSSIMKGKAKCENDCYTNKNEEHSFFVEISFPLQSMTLPLEQMF